MNSSPGKRSSTTRSTTICTSRTTARRAWTSFTSAGAYEGAPRPDLILLDLNLPKYDGRQLLEKIKNDIDLCHIPVVVLTTSAAEEDILKSYKLHANAYVTKPVDLDQFMSAVRQIDEFFVQVVKLPNQ